MKKQCVLVLLIFIFVFGGCKSDSSSVMKEKESINKNVINHIETKEITDLDIREDETLPVEVSTNAEKIEEVVQQSENVYYTELKDTLIKLHEMPKVIHVDTLEDRNLFETIWYVDKEKDGCALTFFNDGRYLLQVNRFGDDVIGDYEIIDNYTIKLIPMLSWGAKEGDYLYPEYYESMTLTLKRDLKNISYSDMLIMEGTNDVFYSCFSTTEVGSECIQGGYEVFKTVRTGAILINRTNLKEKPDINSKNSYVNFSYVINYFIDNPYKMEEYYTRDELFEIFENLDGYLKGMDVISLARTKDKYKINGSEDYWYYVSSYYFEGVYYEGWIYGAYLESFDETKVDEYMKMLMEEIDSYL